MPFSLIAGSGTQHLTDNMVATGDPLVCLPIVMTGANFFVVVVGYYPHQGGQDTKLLSTVFDSSGTNTYSRVRGRTGANNNLTSSDVVEVWYMSGSTASASASMTFTADFAGATFASISVAGFVAPSLPVIVEASAENWGSGLSLDGGNVTTLGTDRLIVGGGTHLGVTFAGGGFTPGTNMIDPPAEYDQSSTTSTSYLVYRLAPTATVYATPETANGTSNAWAAQSVAFAPLVAVPHVRPMMQRSYRRSRRYAA